MRAAESVREARGGTSALVGIPRARSRQTGAGLTAVVAATAVVLASCAAGSEVRLSPEVVRESGLRTEPVDISVSTYRPEVFAALAADFNAAQDKVVVSVVGADYAASHDNLAAALDGGVGAPTVAEIEEGKVAEFGARADLFVDLNGFGAASMESQFYEWKWDQGRAADGTSQFGLPFDVGGLALCYRADLFDGAGLPSDRDEVSALMRDSWDGFFQLANLYKQGTGGDEASAVGWPPEYEGKPQVWGGRRIIDNATNLYWPRVMQSGTGYAAVTRDGELEIASIRNAFDLALEAIFFDHSSNTPTWTPQWNEGVANGDFAAVLCPIWMLDYIEDQVDTERFEGQWDVTDLPGPGGNWGGSMLAIPNQGSPREQVAAWTFIQFATSDESQRLLAREHGFLSAQREVNAHGDVSSLVHPFFNDAPVGEIFSAAAEEIPAETFLHECTDPLRRFAETVLNDRQQGAFAWGDEWDTTVVGSEYEFEACMDEARRNVEVAAAPQREEASQ